MNTPPSTSRSRRSYPNLHNLSIAPLSAKYPLDASVPPSPDEQGTRTPRTSYIAQKSAPTTPGVLSLSQSRSNSRHRPKKAYAYDSYFITPTSDVREAGDIPKAKSTSVLHPGVSFADQVQRLETKPERHPTRKGTAPLPLRSPVIKHHTKETNDEWFHRAGLAIAGETRESKGQGWLVRRESSTSLVGQTDDYEAHPSHTHDDRRMALLSGEHLASSDAEYPVFFSPRVSRVGSRITSRVGSRVPSARQSRRGSRVGSRADLVMSANVASKAPSVDHFNLGMDDDDDDDDDDDGLIEPDFIEADEESDGDDEEVARLARERGIGWMDRLIGWTLFSVDEDSEGSDEEDEVGNGLDLDNVAKEEVKLRREVEAKRRKLERESIVAASAQGAASSRPSTADSRAEEEGGGWQDAAWLLSVASKALF